ncbi:MAG TPA: hypothetical protein DCS93_35465 [Microscillaceae bacterium]|nr:hypothetical protein [Microscillaceae bacterium]
MALKKLLTILFVLVICQSYSFAQNQIEKDIEEKNKAKAAKAKADSIKKALQNAKPKKNETKGLYSNVPITPGVGSGNKGDNTVPNSKTYDPTYFLREENNILGEAPAPKKDSSAAIDTMAFSKRFLSVKTDASREVQQGAITDKSFLASLKSSTINPKDKRFPLYRYKKHKLKLKTFGWHPYWLQDAYKNYNFSLLSAVAFHAYFLDPTNGSYTDPKPIKEWKDTKMIDEAQKRKTKVLLSVYNNGADNNKAFLNNPAARTNFITIILALLKERKANGVHIEFDGLGSGEKQAFTDFILDLSSQLRKSIKNSWLTVSLPPINFNDAYDVRALDKYVDLFILSAGEFYGRQTTGKAGPLSVVKSGSNWWDYDLDRGIDEYLASGVTAEKLLLTINYYGAEWKTDALKPPAKSLGFEKYMTYSQVKKFLGKAEGYEDPESMSMFYPYKDANGYHQIWYEDSLSLSKKYDWVISKKIGGVGIWALGFDNGNAQLWEVLASKMAEPLPKPSVGGGGGKVNTRGVFTRIRSTMMRLIRNPKGALQNPSYFASMLILLLGPAFAGFYVIYRHGCRLRRTMNLLLKGGIIMFLLMAFALTTLVLTRFKHTTPIILILGGFVVGAIVFLLLTRRSLSEREMP